MFEVSWRRAILDACLENRPFLKPGKRVRPQLFIYRVQFPVMEGYERDSWDDATGCIVFTNSRGFVGIGLPRKGGRNTPHTTVTEPGKPTRHGQIR